MERHPLKKGGTNLTKRREFIQRSLVLGAGLSLMPNALFAESKHKVKLCILHTNDWHSRIEPFPMDGGKLQGQGGAAKRAALIKQIRKSEEHVLLLDSGDIFQGTPYFNLFGGELEFKLMSEMGYDAATLGNHDFDAGLEGLNKQLPHAKFPFVIANYDFSKTALAGKFSPYTIVEKSGIKIGIFGLGIELQGLVPESLYGETVYLDPISTANRVAKELKEEKACDYVICLSHLGYTYKSGKISDVKLASESENIDLILGGHTHTFMEQPKEFINKIGHLVIVNQAGWAGVILGRIDVYFDKRKRPSKPRSTMLKVS